MPKQGAFTFVLHSHLPYCRKAGRWPHGEEWIHEAASETYIPLLNALNDLINDGVTPRLTIGITPILTEQLADPTILHNFEEYLDEKITAAQADMDRLADVQAVWDAAQVAEPETEPTPLLSSEELESLISKSDALLSSTAGDAPAPLHAGLLSATAAASTEAEADDEAESEETEEAAVEEPAPIEQPDPHKAYLAMW